MLPTEIELSVEESSAPYHLSTSSSTNDIFRIRGMCSTTECQQTRQRFLDTRYILGVKYMRCRCRNSQHKETHEPLPESFHPVSGWLLWFLIRLNLRNVGHEIHIFRFDRWSAIVEPRSNVQDRKQDERKIVGDEYPVVPVASEKDTPAIELEQCQIHPSK